MKNMSKREKFMMGILVLMLAILGYYYLFYVPTTTEIMLCKQDTVAVEDQIYAAQVKAAKMQKMQKEIDAILAGESGEVKELPAYDNRQNVMNSLSNILSVTDSYNVTFSSVSEADGIIRRNINLNYQCVGYDTAKTVLEQIYNSEYTCLIKNVSLSQGNGSYMVTLTLTYFEYK